MMIISRQKKIDKGLFVALVLMLLVGIANVNAQGEAVIKDDKHFKPTHFLSTLAKVIADMMPKIHYSKRALDDDISKKAFDAYIDLLDGERRFFLKKDIQKYKKYQDELDDMLVESSLRMPFEMYRLLLKRMRDRVEYVRERVKKPFDFTKDEVMVKDRSEAEWCETVEELNALWDRRLKNRLLVRKMMEEEEEKTETEGEDAVESDNKDGPGKDEKAPKDLFLPQRTPEEQVSRFYERYLNYFKENRPIDITEIFMNAICHVYDPHTAYLAPNTEEDFEIEMKLSLSGIGATLTSEQGYVKIVDIIAGGPADKDGELQPGDRILAVTQEGEDSEPVNVVNMPLRRVVDMIRGPKGTTVYLSIIEAGKSVGSKPTIIDIVRDEVQLEKETAKSDLHQLTFPDNRKLFGQPESSDDVTAEMKSGNVLVIHIPSFYADFQAYKEGNEDYRSVSRDVRNLIEDAKKKHSVDGILIDIRSNGGGSLEEAIKIAGLFFPKGPVVQVKDSTGRVQVKRDRDGETFYEGPLVVLTNRFSASASEIVAAAWQDYDRAVIVGDESTHGKGTVQTVHDLGRLFRFHPFFSKKETGSLKFTMAKYYRISGGSTQLKGVSPHITLPSHRDHMELGEAKLPSALPWDNIPALNNVKAFDCFDISPYLDLLKQSSAARRKTDTRLDKRVKLIDEFRELQNRETLSLNLEKRREQLRHEEQLLDRIREQESTNAVDASGEEEDEDKLVRESDLMMQEGLAVMADLLFLKEADLALLENTKDALDYAKANPAPEKDFEN